MDGIININKPLGITSHDVVYKLRRILGIKKIGHTGTLDPDASGVLPMCVGKATKLADMLTASDKEYRTVLTLGVTTDTQDASGEIVEVREATRDEATIRRAISGFTGEIKQIPPMYSAVKIKGKRLYELARKGITVERMPREVFIEDIKVIGINDSKVEMLVKCSKGTYIRTLCHDIGQKLGCGGHMSALIRTRSGRFGIDNAISIGEVEEKVSNSKFDFLTPIDEVLGEYEQVFLSDRNKNRLVNGIPPTMNELCEGKIYRVYDELGMFLTLSELRDGKLFNLKTFFGGI